MEKLQVHVLQNQTARPNASNLGPDSSLQSQNRGLNTQQVKTVGSNDPFWNYVEYMADGSKKCSFCPHTYAIKTSISRIKWHLSGEERRGVAICHGVTKEVQEEALKAMSGGNKRHKNTASSITVNDHGISTCPQEKNIENENIGGGIGRVQREDQVVEVGVGDERISSHAVAGNDVVSMTGMRANKTRVSKGALKSRLKIQPVDRALEQSNLAGKAGRTQVGVQGMEQGAGEERIQSHSQVENAMEDTGEGSFGHDAFQTIPRIEQVRHLESRNSCERPSINQADEPRGDSSQPSNPLCLDHGRNYGQPFPPSVSNDVIMNDVQNMVRGRTKPVEEHDVENSGRLVQPNAGATSSRILKDNISETRGVPFPTSSKKPVGQAFEENMKNLIAKHLHLDLSSEDDDLHRAAKLSEELRQKQKWILILDDLWNNFEPHEVGIHSLLKGCKLILTTRSQTVCHQIGCQHKIEVKSLSEGEAWTLFMEKLGHDMAISLEIEGIAKDIARECAGLPLGIITIARSLRGVDDLREWKTTLKNLRDLKLRDMEKKVFKVLRVSYDRLDDELALKECLLYCALYPEDDMIEREQLIGYLINEGIIKGRRRRQDAFDEGHTMLNRLQYVCLLESVHREYGGRYVKMHDLIRDMAIQIMQENSQVIVKAGAQLEEMLDAEECKENLTRVSLMKNKIRKIPSSYSPMCPNLSTLLLCQNGLKSIPDSFFKHLHGLKVLDLSHTGIENLPESVSDLVSLTALLLIYCGRLRYVPSLEKLRALKSLDLYRTSLEKMPQGMECLSNLRYFRITGCGEKEFPSGILPKLSHLQVFALGQFPTEWYTVEGMEVGCLGKLETLECHFKGFSDFVEYLTSQDGIQSLSTYKISVGTVNDLSLRNNLAFPSKTVKLCNLSINADRYFQVKFLNGIQGLVCESIDTRSLCDVLSLENATELEFIIIESCDSMESLVSSSWFCSATLPLPSHNGMFSCLTEFWCSGCNSMKKLFPLELLSYLVNLLVITVFNCEKMEEIIGATDEESSTSNPIVELTLPKCQKLKRMAISLPLLENGQPSPHPSLQQIDVFPEEWWETVVEWEPPNAKEVLRPIVHFREF
ncbi:disease resistance protein [Salix suchowensis]|nr:disease resistance protein [Salix suchowensis]